MWNMVFLATRLAMNGRDENYGGEDLGGISLVSISLVSHFACLDVVLVLSLTLDYQSSVSLQPSVIR